MPDLHGERRAASAGKPLEDYPGGGEAHEALNTAMKPGGLDSYCSPATAAITCEKPGASGNGKTARTRLIVGSLAGLLALSGCASFQVTVPDSDPIQLEGQAAAYQKKTMHAFFWGLLLDPQLFAAECHGQGINDVVIDRTLAHDLAGVATLGLWMPTEVRFRCKAPPTRPGVLPVQQNPKNISRKYC